MFGLYRIFLLSLRTVLNCLFFPLVFLMVIFSAKGIYDIYGFFFKHTWVFPKVLFGWLFQGGNAWNLEAIHGAHVALLCKYGAYLTLILIFLSNIFGIATLFIKFLRSNSGVRKTLNREEELKEKIIKASDNLEKKYIAKYGISPKPIKVRLIDSRVKNAVIFADNVIVLTTEMLLSSTNEEIEGIIAHEWGHMHNGDTLFNQLNFTNHVISNSVHSGVVYYTTMSIIKGLPRIPVIGIFLSLLVFVFFLPFFILILLFALLSTILSFFEAQISQKQEYLADEFAYGLNAGDGLLTFLYEDMRMQENFGKLVNVGEMFKSTLKSLYNTHPVSHKRIKNLEVKLNKDKPELVKLELDGNKWIS